MPDSSLYLVLFYYCIPDLFLRPFENDRQEYNTVLKIFLSFLLQLTPSVGFAATFPVIGDGLKTCILSFCNNFHLISFIKRISLLPSFRIRTI